MTVATPLSAASEDPQTTGETVAPLAPRREQENDSGAGVGKEEDEDDDCCVVGPTPGAERLTNWLAQDFTFFETENHQQNNIETPTQSGGSSLSKTLQHANDDVEFFMAVDHKLLGQLRQRKLDHATLDLTKNPCTPPTNETRSYKQPDTTVWHHFIPEKIATISRECFE